MLYFYSECASLTHKYELSVSLKSIMLVCVYQLFYKKKNQKNAVLLGKIQNGKPLIKWQNQKLKNIKRKNSNYHIPDLVQ